MIKLHVQIAMDLHSGNGRAPNSLCLTADSYCQCEPLKNMQAGPVLLILAIDDGCKPTGNTWLQRNSIQVLISPGIEPLRLSASYSSRQSKAGQSAVYSSAELELAIVHFWQLPESMWPRRMRLAKRSQQAFRKIMAAR